MSSDLLSRQSEHRSSLVWNGNVETLECAHIVRRFDSSFWRAYQIAPPRVVALIDSIGFGRLARIGYITMDRGLLTALVERWRPETHTFHLTCGEVTVTLEDVAVLWGLPVDGEPLTMTVPYSSAHQWIDVCDRLLGFSPVEKDVTGKRLNKSKLEEHIAEPLSNDASEEQIAQRARGLLLMLIGGHLFSDHSGNKISLRYLLLLEDFDRARVYSWGSGVLAYLYRCLCDASMGSAREVCGGVTLVQLWAWERLPFVRPSRLQPRVEIPDGAAYGGRWAVSFSLRTLPTHVLLTYRDQLDAMTPDQVISLLSISLGINYF